MCYRNSLWRTEKREVPAIPEFVLPKPLKLCMPTKFCDGGSWVPKTFWSGWGYAFPKNVLVFGAGTMGPFVLKELPNPPLQEAVFVRGTTKDIRHN
jgi:hypothetical protein